MWKRNCFFLSLTCWCHDSHENIYAFRVYSKKANRTKEIINSLHAIQAISDSFPEKSVSASHLSPPNKIVWFLQYVFNIIDEGRKIFSFILQSFTGLYDLGVQPLHFSLPHSMLQEKATLNFAGRKTYLITFTSCNQNSIIIFFYQIKSNLQNDARCFFTLNHLL